MKNLDYEITTLANFYGFDYFDATGHPNYKDRKGKVFFLIDRRNGLLECIYSTKQQVKKHLQNYQNRSELTH